jgi:hypothetical protein
MAFRSAVAESILLSSNSFMYSVCSASAFSTFTASPRLRSAWSIACWQSWEAGTVRVTTVVRGPARLLWIAMPLNTPTSRAPITPMTASRRRRRDGPPPPDGRGWAWVPMAEKYRW